MTDREKHWLSISSDPSHFASVMPKPPSTKSYMWLGAEKRKDTVAFEFPHTRPNWWWRMWQYLLFGFRWENTDD